MVKTSPPSTDALASDRLQRLETQLRDLRFLEGLREALAGCGNELDLYGTAVHRIASAFDLAAVSLATYEPISGSIEIRHHAGASRAASGVSLELLRAAINHGRSLSAEGTLAIPVISGKFPAGEGRAWGVLAVARSPADAPFSGAERQTLRSAAACVASELERRRDQLVEDVLDGLLRKTKPIDVYTHALRELRRFVRYDQSASVMTMQRGMQQITVRTERCVGLRGKKETLLDSPRRGRIFRLSAAQLHYLGEVEEPFTIVKQGASYRLSVPDGVKARELWAVLGLEDNSEEGSVLCYPLIFGGQMLGILRIATRRADAFDALGQFSHVLGRFARLLSVTLYRSELYYQSDRQLQAIKQIGRAITEPIPVEEICRQVLELALRVLHVQVGAVGLLNEEGKLELVAHQGCTLEEPPILSVGEGIAGHVVQAGVSRAVPDVTRDPDYVVLNARARSELVAPITYNREVIGFLDVESYEEGRFREEDEEVVTFLEALANQAAIAIKTAQLHFEAVTRLGATMSIDPALSTAGLQDLLIQELRDKIEQLASANDRLAAANRAKSDFLARMSHDLRGPLNVIVGLTNLLTDPSVGPTLTPEKRQESLKVIRSSGEVLSSLIGNILDLSALEAGRVELSLSPVHAPTAFAYLGSMARTLANEANRELDISVTVDEGIDTITVDEEKFLRILINLISNAVKFTPAAGQPVSSSGQLMVAATIDSTGSQDPALHVMVRDSGVGIAPEHHEAIFEPFRRIEGVGSGGPHGTGLGLAVVRQLAELHGGRVWVESVLGEGSAFHVLLPHALALRTEAAPVTAPPTAERAIRQPAPKPGGGHSRGLVLVVEDNDAHMNLMRLAVTSRGYEMHGVPSGEEAIEWLRDNKPEVILLDMQLPGIDGFDVAAQIKGQVELQSVPLIAVTANALAITEQRALASGCDAYLTKPIDIGTLLKTIDAIARA